MTARKVRLKALKHFCWKAIALWSGFTLVAYFTPVSELLAAFPFQLSGFEEVPSGVFPAPEHSSGVARPAVAAEAPLTAATPAYGPTQ